jgi:hypothetical protein
MKGFPLMQNKFIAGGSFMDKDHLDQKDDLNLSLNRNAKEVLEISSTGYGLESVLKVTEEEQNSPQSKNNPPSFGGL